MKSKVSSRLLDLTPAGLSGKRSRASLKPLGRIQPIVLRAVVVALLLAAAAMLAVSGYLSQGVLTVSNQKTGEMYFQTIVEPDDILTYHWIHSFELIPWIETYQIDQNHKLILKEIKVAGFGAGIPENKGQTTIENGMVIMRDLDEPFESIQWIHSKTALTSIELSGEVILEGSDLPHHEPIQLEVKGRLITWLKHLSR